LKFQAVAEKTAKDARGLLYFAAPGTLYTKKLYKQNSDIQMLFERHDSRYELTIRAMPSILAMQDINSFIIQIIEQ